jgi:hypothetical protein
MRKLVEKLVKNEQKVIEIIEIGRQVVEKGQKFVKNIQNHSLINFRSHFLQPSTIFSTNFNRLFTNFD